MASAVSVWCIPSSSSSEQTHKVVAFDIFLAQESLFVHKIEWGKVSVGRKFKERKGDEKMALAEKGRKLKWIHAETKSHL